MKVKNTMAVAFVSLLALSAYCEDVTGAKERIKAWKRHTGGYVTQQDPGNGMVAIVNSQSRIAGKVLKRVAKYYRDFTASMPFEVVDAKPPRNATYTVTVVEKPDCEHPLTIWPESRRAEVNVTPLAKDVASKQVIEDRVLKEVSRAIALLVGGGSQYPNTLAGADGGAKRLDGFPGFEMPPDVFLRIGTNLRMADVRPVRRVTYREACQEGWAAQPTNDYQKAVWDEVHKMPTTPMKIEFDPKKGR